MAKLPKEQRKKFPNFVPSNDGSSSFVISNHGYVYRVDMGDEPDTAQLTMRDPITRGDGLIIRLSGGRVTRSIPLAMFLAFGNLKRPTWDPSDLNRRKGEKWRLWIRPDAPLVDYVTVSAKRCSVLDVQWVYGPTHQRRATDPDLEIPAHHVVPIWVPNPKKWKMMRVED